MQIKFKSFAELTAGELYEILKSRCEVFMLEQRIICQDMDDVDYRSYHCFLQEGERVVAYLRAYYDENLSNAVRVGRVLTLEHGIGLGRRIMRDGIDCIKANMSCDTIVINAQKHAIGFYRKLDFEVTSDEFLEEGVVHVEMQLKL